jgi:DNA invertase Pin-like site-specific DNA recombinase
MFEEVPENCLYDYVRASSKLQEENSSLEFQRQELFSQGVPEKNIRVEVGSTADPIQERPVLFHLVEKDLRENDLLVVTKIDQCSRNTLYFLKLQEKIFKESVTLISLDLPHSSDMAVNKLISTLLFYKIKKELNKTIKKIF